MIAGVAYQPVNHSAEAGFAIPDSLVMRCSTVAASSTAQKSSNLTMGAGLPLFLDWIPLVNPYRGERHRGNTACAGPVHVEEELMTSTRQGNTCVSAALGTIALLGVVPVTPANAAGIVASIDKATVSPDGNVSGMPGSYLITLDSPLDPAVPGKSLAAGGQIKVIFPRDFDLANLDPTYPLLDVPTPGQCTPGNLVCTTAVLLKGWPEEPYFPPAAFASLSVDLAENALVFTATQNIDADPPASPGIKQLFLMLHGMTNPAPGQYRVRVEAQTGPSSEWETGSELLQVLPNSRPSIGATSVFVKALSGLLPGGAACAPPTLPPNPDNPVYQTTAVGSEAPFVWTFLLWGDDNAPLADVWLNWVNPNHAQLKQLDATIGHLFIDAPQGAIGHGIEANPVSCATMIGAAPVIGGTLGIGPDPVGRLDLRFRTGDIPGDYTTTISLNNGNSVQMVVTAEH